MPGGPGSRRRLPARPSPLCPCARHDRLGGGSTYRGGFLRLYAVCTLFSSLYRNYGRDRERQKAKSTNKGKTLVLGVHSHWVQGACRACRACRCLLLRRRVVRFGPLYRPPASPETPPVVLDTSPDANTRILACCVWGTARALSCVPWRRYSASLCSAGGKLAPGYHCRALRTPRSARTHRRPTWPHAPLPPPAR